MKFAFICSLFIFLVTNVGCAGKGPNPIRVEQYNDKFLSCKEIEQEVQKAIAGQNFERAGADELDRQNLTAYIAGQLLLFPMLAMDVTGSKEIELNAIKRRMVRLQQLSADKGC